jgi:CRISPR-associated protein Csc3
MTDDMDPAQQEPFASFNPAEFGLALEAPAEDETIFRHYLAFVANDGLLPLRQVVHFSASQDGGKAGETLYTHLLNGIFVLDQLRRLLGLGAVETRVLFAAFTLHDINKFPEHEATRSYRRVATPEHIIESISRLKLDQFFPGYDRYIADMRALIQLHPGHNAVGIDFYDLTRAPRFGLRPERLRDLADLIQAADAIDLSHTLDEARHKATFLHKLNSVSSVQYSFVTHQVAEQRGSLTNIVHNAAMAELQSRFGLVPLLLYPEGVAYLCRRGHEPACDDAVRAAIAKRAAGTVATMTSAGFQSFIRPINMGITVDRKCLELGLPFATIFATIAAIVQRRPYKPEKLQQLAADAATRTRRALAKRPLSPDAPLAAAVEGLLARGLVPQSGERVRLGELVRSYYIFLLEHLAEVVADAWPHLYRLLDLPADRVPLYDLLDARMDRAYAIAADLTLSEQELYTRIVADGEALLAAVTRPDPREPLLAAYLSIVLSFGGQPARPGDFTTALPQYVRQRQRQCVQCSLPLPTEPWMAADVRGDIKVQSFSNRLPGAPSEPKKRVCGVCQLQYLVEKLNYREVREEQPLYLHLFPYSFLAAPFAAALRRTVERIRELDALGGAMRLREAERAFATVAAGGDQRVIFTTRTKEDKPQPYGLYLPRYSDTLAGMLTFPVNPPGANDGERFLFVLQHALLIWRVLGTKVLVSTAATPPLDARAFGDLYLDLTPLDARGLVTANDYHWFAPGGNEPGGLQQLWKRLGMLYAIKAQVSTRTDDPLPALVRALADHPLTIFYVAEKLAEERARAERGDRGAAGWILSRVAPALRELALSTGDPAMSDLDRQLEQLAALAWRGGLRSPKSLKKNSLMTPLDAVLAKVALISDELTLPLVRAAAVEDLRAHIERVRRAEGLKTGRFHEEASRAFVTTFFDEVFLKTYQGRPARLLSHEKALRSAFHTYVRQQIPTRLRDSEVAPADTADESSTKE